MNRYTLLLLSLSFCFTSFSQLTNEEIVDKKDDILLKSNETIMKLIDEIDSDIYISLHEFEIIKLRLFVNKGDMSELNFWKKKADAIGQVTAETIHALLEEMNQIAQLADDSDKDYVWRDGYTRKARSLKSLYGIGNIHDRSTPFQRIFGENFLNPKPEGIHIENKLLSFKNEVFSILGNYSYDGYSSSFTPFEHEEHFEKSIENIHPIDTSRIQEINNIITLNSLVYTKDVQSDETVTVTWMMSNFAYSSVLETAVSINQVVLKIKLIEKHALRLLLDKINKGC